MNSKEYMKHCENIGKCVTCQEIQNYFKENQKELRELDSQEYGKLLDCKEAKIFQIEWGKK